MWGWSEVVGCVGRGMDIPACARRHWSFDIALPQSCVEQFFAQSYGPCVHIFLRLKRRRLLEPCGAVAAKDERAASTTSPSAPEQP